jgi:myo-inositol catabolism protein IolC
VTTPGHPAPLLLLRAAADDDLAPVAAACGDVRPVGPARFGVLLDDDAATDVAAAARANGWVVAAPSTHTVDGALELSRGERFGGHLDELGADIAAVALDWNPADDPDHKKARVLVLVKLAAWLHETDRELLVDLRVPATTTDLDEVDGDDRRYRTERRPELIARAMQELRDLGVEVDLWVVDRPADRDAAKELAASALDEGRDEVAILVEAREDDAPEGSVATVTGYRGEVVGRAAWARRTAAEGDVAEVAGDLVRRLGAYGEAP